MSPQTGADSAQAAQVKQSLGSLANEARRRSRLARLMLHVLIAAIASYWIGAWALLWLAGIQMLERAIEPLLSAHVLARFAARGAGEAEWAGAGMRALTAIAFAMSWAPAWAIGGEAAGFFAGMMIGGALIHALVYFSNSHAQFAAAVVPPVTAAAIVVIFAHGLAGAHILALPVMGVAVLRAHWARRDQIELFHSVDRQRALRREAEEASRAKSQFMATMTHELRTPLNAVINFAEMIEEDLRAEGRAGLANDAARIRRSGKGLMALIDDVVDFTMLESGQIIAQQCDVDLRKLIEAEIEAVRPLAEAHGDSIDAIIDPQVGCVRSDPVRLRRCIAALVGNACKFTENGRVLVRCTRAPGAVGALNIIVEDTGCGIAPEQLERLFQPFAQVDSSFTRAKDGAGLGLAIAGRIARLLGGEITVRSTPGAGSTFTLTLPETQATAAPEEHTSLEAAA